MTSQHTEALDKQFVEQIARAATGNKRQGESDSCYRQGNGGTQHPDPRSLQLCPKGAGPRAQVSRPPAPALSPCAGQRRVAWRSPSRRRKGCVRARVARGAEEALPSQIESRRRCLSLRSLIRHTSRTLRKPLHF